MTILTLQTKFLDDNWDIIWQRPASSEDSITFPSNEGFLEEEAELSQLDRKAKLALTLAVCSVVSTIALIAAVFFLNMSALSLGAALAGVTLTALSIKSTVRATHQLLEKTKDLEWSAIFAVRKDPTLLATTYYSILHKHVGLDQLEDIPKQLQEVALSKQNEVDAKEIEAPLGAKAASTLAVILLSKNTIQRRNAQYDLAYYYYTHRQLSEKSQPFVKSLFKAAHEAGHVKAAKILQTLV